MVSCGGPSQPIPVKPTITATESNVTPLPTWDFNSSPLTPVPIFTPPPMPVISNGIFAFFQSSSHDLESLRQRRGTIIKTIFGVVQPGDTIEEKISIDATMSYTGFSCFWEGGDLDLTLIEPDGMITDQPSYLFREEDEGYKRYPITVPSSGTWAMRIFDKSTSTTGTTYMIQVTTGIDAMLFSGSFDKPEYVSGDLIKLSASIEDDLSGSLRTPEYIYNVSMKILVEDPAKKQFSFELFDDGLHQDKEADDGIYATVFGNTELPGKYIFYLQISGLNNRAKQPFTREYFLTTVVH
jgi:hypothetical protein